MAGKAGKENKGTNRIKTIFLYLVVGVLILFTDRTLRYSFLFTFSYRMQTISKYMPILCSWIIFAAFIVFAAIRKFRFSWGAIIPYAIIYAGYLISTIINDGMMERLIDAFVYSLPPFLLAVIAFSNEKLTKIYLRCAALIFSFMLALNLLFEYVPQMWTLISEWREECFLGYHTEISWPLILGLMYAYTDMKYSGNKWLFAIYALLFFANTFAIHPGGAVIGAMIVAVWMILPFIRTMFSNWSLSVFIVLVIALFAALMFALKPLVNLSPVKFFIENILHKDLTLSGRLYVWTGAWKCAMESPVLGHGIQESSQIFFESSKWNNAMVHAHNLFLQCIYEGGFATLILGLAMLFYTALKTEKVNLRTLNIKKHNLSSFFKMLIFATLVMFQSDQDVYYNWFLLAFMCHVYLILPEIKNE